MSSDCIFDGVVGVVWVISQISMFMSDVCPGIWHLSFFDRPGASVVLGWNPISISLIVELGSVILSLK